MRAILGASWFVLTGVAMAACASADAVGLEDESGYVQIVRSEIPSAKEYSDGELIGAAEKVCYTGALPDGTKVIADELDKINPQDREKVAYYALTEGCPGGGTG